jgi:hypothetical protein
VKATMPLYCTGLSRNVHPDFGGVTELISVDADGETLDVVAASVFF